jgi:hypothetical protein
VFTLIAVEEEDALVLASIGIEAEDAIVLASIGVEAEDGLDGRKPYPLDANGNKIRPEKEY